MEGAADNYIKAIQMYRNLPSHGKRSVSYLATLSNLGLLYKDMAVKEKGLERARLLGHADDALREVLEVRQDLLGPLHRDTIAAELNIATLLRVQGKGEECLSAFGLLLEHATAALGPADLLISTICNNQGLAQKSMGLLTEAKASYERALSLRLSALGPAHTDTIVVMHNLAECALAAGDEQAAKDMQHRIMELLPAEKAEAEVEIEKAAAKAATPSASASAQRVDPVPVAAPKPVEFVPFFTPVTRKKTS